MLPPSQHVMFQYSRDLFDFGATSVRASGPQTVVASFEPKRDWSSALLAAGALRDSVLGAQLVVVGADGSVVPPVATNDTMFAPATYAAFIARNPRVASARPHVDGLGNTVIKVRTHTPEGAAHLSQLLRDEVGPGVPVQLMAQPWVRQLL